jgi:hypothetical protein
MKKNHQEEGNYNANEDKATEKMFQICLTCRGSSKAAVF